MSNTPDRSAVRRRLVLFIPGFDPSPRRRYRELYRREAALQVGISGYALEMSAAGGAGWDVSFTDLDGSTRTRSDIRILDWSDLVRAATSVPTLQAMRQMVQVSWLYVHSGALRSVARLRRGPFLVGLFPVVFALLLLVTAFALSCATAMVLFPFLGPAAWGVAAGLLCAMFMLYRRQRSRLFIGYLARDVVFWASDRGTYDAALCQRIEQMARALEQALQEPEWDEVLLVGHSSGAQIAVSVLAEAMARAPDPTRMPSLLTLGQAIPMASLLPDAERLRGDLARVAALPDLCWIDITAPGDPCCFALCDPVSVSGAGPAGVPLVLSAAFRQTLSASRQRALRWRFLGRHLQYLCASDAPGRYDYFRITAGPTRLKDLFAGRRPSPQRITRCVLPGRVAPR